MTFAREISSRRQQVRAEWRRDKRRTGKNANVFPAECVSLSAALGMGGWP